MLVERYRLEERLSGPDPLGGSLWRAVDVMAGDLPVAMRQLQLPAAKARFKGCLLYTSPSPRDLSTSRMPSSA